ncbi:outer-membrane lipoprotein carrier protein [Escherichia coli]|uniref:Outer-membrane lipoprotein carrier protein n=1 Tax=Escherichia coli TaxID=562 RepID=A0A376K3C3_ECOLX|nr:outer-membrane lipoprotein carrier protein [Escherichia coli]
MKKIAITCALLSSLVASSVWADAASDLKSRLDKVSSFHASFTQKVTDVAARRCRKARAICG